MDAKYSPRTDQRARVRPISFLLDIHGSVSDPITLPIRPEDLTRTEPARAAVHQTLGREVSGWVDNFGEGLPSVNISGTTGWHYNPSLGRDGVQSFEALNEMVVHRYSQFRQISIDTGLNPAGVKLLFVDLLDNFCWSVVPTTFVLRRSKSRPLLMQYNINLQAVSTAIDAPLIAIPFFGTVSAGLGALGSLESTINGFIGGVEGLVTRALSFVDRVLGPIASVIKTFVNLTAKVLSAVLSVVNGIRTLATGIANRLISIASDIAKVGINVFRTLSAIAGLPSDLKAALSRVASAYNEMACILANSLRPRPAYEEYSGLYGASNCSSTTGGRQPSAYGQTNAFNLIVPAKDVVLLTSGAQSSMSALVRMDPVLAPLPYPEISRHLGELSRGATL